MVIEVVAHDVVVTQEIEHLVATEREIAIRILKMQLYRIKLLLRFRRAEICGLHVAIELC
ncbi:hypothetical protein AO715_14445 [Xanthomonas sp. Mitacek01]|nr:hypothetical protein AO715_14445 [Xanthomonas sp. Mitacek01]